MRGAILHAPRDIRVEQREDPTIEQATDAVIRLAATCVCGSDLWPYRGIEPVSGPAPMGHEYAGIVEETGPDVRSVKPGQFVVGSFFASDNTCEICRAGYQSSLHPPPAHRVDRHPGRAGPDPARRWHPGRHPRGAHPRTWCPACWPPPTCSAPAGSAPAPPRCTG